MPAFHWKAGGRRLFVAMFLLVVGGVLTWRFRRLSDAERRLIGSWNVQLDDDQSFCSFEFEPNRRFAQISGGPSGSAIVLFGRWRVRGDTLLVTYDGNGSGGWSSFVQRMKDLVTGTPQSLKYLLEFDGERWIGAIASAGPNTLQLELWRRVAEEPNRSAGDARSTD